jgi:hypothetical protein
MNRRFNCVHGSKEVLTCRNTSPLGSAKTQFLLKLGPKTGIGTVREVEAEQ